MRARLDVQAWLFIAAGVMAIVIVSIDIVPDIIIYNPSPSIPRGFYVRDGGAPVRGAIVTVRAIDVAPDYARLRDFTDLGDRFIKRVAAADGDIVCANGAVVTINGVTSVRRASRDSAGRTLPAWSGCHALQNEFLLLGDTADSFDGRYWGPISAEDIDGVWRRVGVWRRISQNSGRGSAPIGGTDLALATLARLRTNAANHLRLDDKRPS